jgi:hypothetical protein
VCKVRDSIAVCLADAKQGIGVRVEALNRWCVAVAKCNYDISI